MKTRIDKELVDSIQSMLDVRLFTAREELFEWFDKNLPSDVYVTGRYIGGVERIPLTLTDNFGSMAEIRVMFIQE